MINLYPLHPIQNRSESISLTFKRKNFNRVFFFQIALRSKRGEIRLFFSQWLYYISLSSRCLEAWKRMLPWCFIDCGHNKTTWIWQWLHLNLLKETRKLSRVSLVGAHPCSHIDEQGTPPFWESNQHGLQIIPELSKLQGIQNTWLELYLVIYLIQWRKNQKLGMSNLLADHECILIPRHNFKEKEEASVRLVLKIVSYSGKLSPTVTFPASQLWRVGVIFLCQELRKHAYCPP